jgi:hypothetical protein
MFQLILALTFVGMILTPAVVAAFSGKKELEVENEEMETAQVAAPQAARIAQPAKRQRNTESARPVFQAATLPMHGTLGMAGR